MPEASPVAVCGSRENMFCGKRAVKLCPSLYPPQPAHRHSRNTQSSAETIRFPMAIPHFQT